MQQEQLLQRRLMQYGRIITIDLVLFSQKDGKWVVLLVRHKKPELAGMIGVPGGKLEHHQTPEECLYDEILNETGIHCHVYHPKICRQASNVERDTRFPTFGIVYVAECDEPPEITVGEELEDVFWMPVEEAELTKLMFDHNEHLLAALEYLNYGRIEVSQSLARVHMMIKQTPQWEAIVALQKKTRIDIPAHIQQIQTQLPQTFLVRMFRVAEEYNWLIYTGSAKDIKYLEFYAKHGSDDLWYALQTPWPQGEWRIVTTKEAFDWLKQAPIQETIQPKVAW